MRRLLAFTALPLALAAAMLGPGAAKAATAESRPSTTCILGIICLPGGSSPTPVPSPASPSPSTASPSPAPSPPAGPGPAPSGQPAPSATSSTSAGLGPGPSPSSAGKARKGPRKAAAKRAAAAAGLVASAAGSVLTAGSATLSGFGYQGNVDMPVAGGGTVTMMKFTADSMTLAGGVTDAVTQDGVTTSTASPTLAFGGGVTLYATKLSGSLLGVPVTFTPSTVSAILLRIANLVTSVVPITLTGVTTDQPLASAGSLRTGQLTLGFGG